MFKRMPPRGRANTKQGRANTKKRIEYIRGKYGDVAAGLALTYTGRIGGRAWGSWVDLLWAAAQGDLRAQQEVAVALQHTSTDHLRVDRYLPWIAQQFAEDPHGLMLLREEPNEDDRWVHAVTARYNPHRIRAVVDWAHATRANLAQINLGMAMQRAEAWHTDLRERTRKAELLKGITAGKVIHTWPDGWTLQNLPSSAALKAEGEAMRHCVAGYWEDVQAEHIQIWSLRDPKNQPHVTLEIGGHFEGSPGRPDTILQAQGKGNKNPKTEYVRRLWQFDVIRTLKDRSGVFLTYQQRLRKVEEIKGQLALRRTHTAGLDHDTPGWALRIEDGKLAIYEAVPLRSEEPEIERAAAINALVWSYRMRRRSPRSRERDELQALLMWAIPGLVRFSPAPWLPPTLFVRRVVDLPEDAEQWLDLLDRLEWYAYPVPGPAAERGLERLEALGTHLKRLWSRKEAVVSTTAEKILAQAEAWTAALQAQERKLEEANPWL